MPHLWLTILAVMFLLTLFIVNKYQRKKSTKTKQIAGINHIKNLRVVLALLQKHRGLTSTFIKGEHSLKKAISSVQQEANHTINFILQSNQAMLTNERWFSVTDHWQRLSDSYVNNTVENNVLQHNSMIQNMLYLIDDLAVSHELTRLKLKGVDNIRLIWKEWLTAIECIGQARAMGSAILAEGSCSSVSRIRLSYLQEKISETTDKAWCGLPVSETQKQQLVNVINCIKNDIINSSIANNLTLASSDYFSLCSAVMDSYYQQFDQFVEQL